MTTLAIILTGGRSARMGGRHKPALRVGGETVVDRVIAAARAADPTTEVVVAGSPEGVTGEVAVVREDPPFAGPLAGIAAALDAVAPDPSRTVLLLAGDMPFLHPPFLRRLVAHAPATARDENGRWQFLCAAWGERALRARIAELGDVAGAPMRRLHADEPTPLDAPPGTMRDIDTPADAVAAGAADPDDRTPDMTDIAAFWREARLSVPTLPADPPAADRVWGFGATPEHADSLLALVLDGVKTGTAGYLWQYEDEGEDVTAVGELDVILDGSASPRAVIETVAVEVVPFNEVTAEHAHAEGEDDRTLASWRRIHRQFFEDHIDVGRGFHEAMPMVCERFRVVYPRD